MKYQEKKYRVESFEQIKSLLEKAGAKRGTEVVSTHYYILQPTNDVVKLVVTGNKCEIHILTENDGKYSLMENISMESVEAGLNWLKNRGYKEFSVIKMDETDYEYKGGIVGLYTINDFLCSVILDFPPGKHEELENELGLEDAEVINVPYNKYLEQIGKINKIPLSSS